MLKVAVVSGASGRGIGRSVALTLAREGFSLVVNYRTNKAMAEELCAHVEAGGGKAVPVQADVFTAGGCEALVNETILHCGRLDALVVGPGAAWNPEPPDRIVPARSLQDVVQEVSPLYWLLPRVLPEMEKTGGGRIIGIASNPRLPSPSYSYNAAKNARIAAFIGLADWCWKRRITVNVVAPGPVDPLGGMEEAAAQAAALPTDARKISPQDIAETVAFLCSEKARFVTGNVIGTQF
jgi:3-oxoacyl-[acyl-carrier protein] reductase